jgi:hypothetical protein
MLYIIRDRRIESAGGGWCLLAPLWTACLLLLNSAIGQEVAINNALHPKLVHLRNEPTREWSSFPAQAENTKLELSFAAETNAKEFALRIRQQDVKQLWRVLLNGKPLGELIRDEADLVFYLPVPAQALKNGENILLIEAKAGGKPAADDIRVGELSLEPKPVREVLSAATCEIDVHDVDDPLVPLPVRLTIVNKEGALQATSAVSTDSIAARPGVIYTATGRAKFSLPAGEYTIYAGRGFEYSVATLSVKLAAGQLFQKSLTIRREVPTNGFVACDTHVHTLTHSGHGDSTFNERLITLACEGIELPIATDHNKQVNYRPTSQWLSLDQHFTPVIGNEVTTTVGHFNIFPIAADARAPNHQLKTWEEIFREIFAVPDVQVCILNHARDIHSGTRPFGPDLFNATVGENYAGWPMRFNAMEVINSGATQNEPLQLLHDWLALLNRGYQVTPVGSSDSHDVSRYIVGQGRTYIRCDDRNEGRLDTNAAIKNFLAGRVAVSYGLLAELTVDEKFQPGDLATGSRDEMHVQVRVLGPHWTTANRVQLYGNGQLLREEKITPPTDRSTSPGVQWDNTWRLPRPKHDVHLVAVALGPGIDAPYWAMAKPYQPTSPEFTSLAIGISGAVWVDGDHDGKALSARGYAEQLVKSAAGDLSKLVTSLKEYDAAIAAQATHLFLTEAKSVNADALEAAIKTASPATANGMRTAWQAFREQELARAKKGA